MSIILNSHKWFEENKKEIIQEIKEQIKQTYYINVSYPVYQKILNMKALFFRTGMKYSFTRNIFEINKYIN